MTWTDLSHPVSSGMSRASQQSAPQIRTVKDVSTDKINLMEYTVGTHLGTHVDAPLHFLPGGASIDQLPLSSFVGSGVVLAVPGKPDTAITADDLSAASIKPRPGDITLLSTGWGKLFGAADYLSHPYLDDSAAEWFIEHGVKMLAIDFVTPELPEPLRSPGHGWPVHHKLLSAGVLIAENVADLSALEGRPVEVVAAPINIGGADGAPVRMLARPRP